MTTNAPISLKTLVEQDPEYQAACEQARAATGEWLSVEATAALLGRSVRQIRRYEAAGKMPPRRKFGRERRYPQMEIEKMRESLANWPTAN